MIERDLDQLAADEAPRFAKDLKELARRGGSEADFRREAAKLFDETAAAVGLAISPRDEYHVARGNVDSVYNRLILEYKRPGLLRSTNASVLNNKAIDQVKGYIVDVAVRERREASRLAGVVTDGFYLIFVRRVGDGWSVDEAAPINDSSGERLLRLLFSLSTGAALIAENLVEDFGPRQWRAKTAVRAIYRGFSSSKSPLVEKLFVQWRQFFSEATDYKEWSERLESKPEFREFVGSLWTKEELRHLDAARVFFVLRTYYALLIKLVASLASARFAGAQAAPLSVLAAKTGDDLKSALSDLERGGLFREYGIRNFLEGDFFGWYLAAWKDDIEGAVSALIGRLAQYDPGALELAPENARDLLKKLYHSLLPKEIRHDLGEYYTPDWLAERLIKQTLGEADLGDGTKRVLDPACGSGTFLVILIKFIKERAARNNQPPKATLELILSNVVGFDLNPLAVIAARTNFLIALGELIRERGDSEIDIPVYQADSILAPSQGSSLFEGNVYPLRTSVGIFRVPAVFANRERMDALANTLDGAVEAGIEEAAFVDRVTTAAALEPEELQAVGGELVGLYNQLRNLHDEGVNGVWARIIKNAFAPVFLEACHYVIGNPPWVNWESLPEDYRSESKPMWEHYGLFPHGGMDTILGKGKKDISMLMTYVSVDRYLRRGGKLGFVFSQSLFKTTGAGQGFRRFMLPDGTPFGPLTVEDMVDLAPFEGAANRTAVAVLSKGRSIRYPLTYLRWKKRGSGRGSGIGFDTPLEQVTAEKVTFTTWYAEPVDSRDPTSAWITARRGALRAIRKILGPSVYSAHAGAFTGGANGIFWLEITATRPGGLSIVSNITEGARRKVAQTQAAIETDLLYPLLRGRDVGRWSAAPSAHILMTQDPRTRQGIEEHQMQSKYPRAYGYLKRHVDVLENRPAYRRYFNSQAPFYSLFDIGMYTFSPWKVAWREQAATFTASVVGPHNGRAIVADHKLMTVEAASQAEAHYLCAVLNSAPATFAVFAYTIQVSMDTHVLENVSVPKFAPRNPVHAQLAHLSEMAHQAAEGQDSVRIRDIEKEIDQLAANLWGLSASELAEIQNSLREA